MKFNLITIINILLLCHFVDSQRSSPCHRKCKYVEAFQQANCEYRSLNVVPIECNAASYLSLRYNHITTIEPGLFKGFPFLKYLILSNNNISRVEANTFMGAPQLKSIKLLYNNLQVLDRNALNGTENRLRNIYLSRNSLKVIENGTFQLVPRLEVIDLYRNRLTELTPCVFEDLDHLERLFLGMNELVHLPDNIFKDLTSLVYLDLSTNFISSLTIDLFLHMNHLKTVDLSGNRLVDIGNILNLPNIRLDLRWNLLGQLGNVCLEILNSNVETLYLEGNPLYCNCSIEPLRLWYKGLSETMINQVTTDNPVCSGPQRLANSTIYSLKVSLCHDMTAESTKISTVYLAMNLGGYDHIGNVTNATALMYQNVTGNSEISKANGRLKVIIITSFAAIVLVVIFVAVSVVLLKRRSYETKEKKGLDFERSVPKPSESSAGVSEINDTGTSKSSGTPTSVSLMGATTSKENINENIRNETCNTEKTPSPRSAIKFREGVLLGEVTNKQNNTEDIKNETCNIEQMPSPGRNGKKFREGNLLGEVTNKENNNGNFRNETCNIEKTPSPRRTGNRFREGTLPGVVTNKENINGIIKSKACNAENPPSPSRSAKRLPKVESNRKTRNNLSYGEKKFRLLRL